MMRGVCFLLMALLPGLLCGCLSKQGLKSINDLVVGMEGNDQELMAPTLVTSVGELGIGVSAACAKELPSYAVVDPKARSVLAARFAATCKLSCPRNAKQIAEMPATDQMRATLASCDHEGADPIFGGALAEQRERVGFGDYVLTRHALLQLRTLLMRQGSPEAKGLWARIEKQLPRLMSGMIKRQEEVLHPTS